MRAATFTRWRQPLVRADRAHRAGTNLEEIRRCQTEGPLSVQQLVARKVPAPVIALLRSMLAVDPDERPASARELMEAIEECRLKLTGGNEHPPQLLCRASTPQCLQGRDRLRSHRVAAHAGRKSDFSVL